MTPEFTVREEKRIGLYFKISILGKGLISLGEIAVGLVVLFIPVSYFTGLLATYAHGELLEEPGNLIAPHLVALAQQFSVASSLFIAVYLLSRGSIKVFLIAAMLKRLLWAYPASLAVIGLFVLYQMYQITLVFSAPLIALTVFDLIVMYFIWREYQVLKFESH